MMKLYAVLILAATVTGSFNSEEQLRDFRNFGDLMQDEISEETSGSFEGLALGAPDGWQYEALNFVNKLRARANLQPYIYDETVAATAQNWADKMACAQPHYHESPPEYAENIADIRTSLGEVEMAKKGIQMWYDEYKVYTCVPVTTKGTYYKSVGHYMNLMRKDFQKIGFGMTVCPSNPEIGALVARMDDNPEIALPMWREQMKRQGLPTNSNNGMDKAAFVPCPSSFPAA